MRIVEIHSMTAVIYVLINLGETILISNCTFMLLHPNFCLLLCFTYVYSFTIIATNLINNVCFITYSPSILVITYLTTDRII